MLVTTLVICSAVSVFAETPITEEKCDNSQDPDDNDLIRAIKNYAECMKRNFDIEAIKKDIVAANTDYAVLHEIFNKQCEKSSVVKTCLPAPIGKLSPCPAASAVESTSFDDNTGERLVNFLCENNGEKAATYFAEGGPGCYQLYTKSIRDCLKKLQGRIHTYEDLKKLTVPEQCTLYDDLSVCVLKPLEECQKTGARSVVESLLQLARSSLLWREIIIGLLFW